MDLLYLKALHIIFVVTWFAGLFYIVRLFIYHVESQEMEVNLSIAFHQQYSLMEKRLWYGITWPSAVLALLFGMAMFHYFKGESWLNLKLFLVLLLFLYHLSCGAIYRRFQRKDFFLSSTKLRIWNEVATLFLFSIVFLVVLKDRVNMIKGLVGFLALAALLGIGIKIYRKMRLKRES